MVRSILKDITSSKQLSLTLFKLSFRVVSLAFACVALLPCYHHQLHCYEVSVMTKVKVSSSIATCLQYYIYFTKRMCWRSVLFSAYYGNVERVVEW